MKNELCAETKKPVPKRSICKAEVTTADINQRILKPESTGLPRGGGRHVVVSTLIRLTPTVVVYWLTYDHYHRYQQKIRTRHCRRVERPADKRDLKGELRPEISLLPMPSTNLD